MGSGGVHASLTADCVVVQVVPGQVVPSVDNPVVPDKDDADGSFAFADAQALGTPKWDVNPLCPRANNYKRLFALEVLGLSIDLLLNSADL